MILAFIIPFFIWIHYHTSPLGKYAFATFKCETIKTPIVGLEVSLYEGTGFDTLFSAEVTGADGVVTWYGLEVGKIYHYRAYWWDGEHTSGSLEYESADLNFYTCYLKNPEVHKTFIFEILGTPVEDLPVTLVGYGTETTNADGYVSWILDYPFGDYTLEWTWKGADYSESVLWADFVEGVWTAENKLEPKSGGGVNLHLPEESG